MQPPQLQQRFWFEVPLPRALWGLLAYQERLPSPLWVFIMDQCCKITGFPQCFLLFARLCHGNLERVHVGDSGLSCKAPHSGIHDVSASCAKAFLRPLSDSSTQELHCRDEEITVQRCGTVREIWGLIRRHTRSPMSPPVCDDSSNMYIYPDWTWRSEHGI